VISQEFIAVLYGLGAAVSWGTGDFSGGLATKSGGVYGVLLITNIIGLAILATAAFWLGHFVRDLFPLSMGAAAGIFSCFGLAALYKALADGRMGTVAPLTAVIAAALPVVFGTLLEGAPSGLQMTGFVFAFVAIWFLTSPGGFQNIQRQALVLPVAAGLCFGLTYIFIDHATSQKVLWPLIAARCSAIAVLIFILKISRTATLPPPRKLPAVWLAGFGDTGGTILYALAAHTGRLDISAVLASMYPAATVMLAWIILKERLSGGQQAGIAAALLALAFIAA
jgi:drug/metabolite transporter (DMT)-like permease